MKHLVASALCLVVALCLLCGCAKTGPNVICKDLSLTLPADFMDLSSENYAGDADLFYGRKTLIVKGLAEKKADLVEMTLEDPACRNNPVAVDGFLVRRILEEITGRI